MAAFEVSGMLPEESDREFYLKNLVSRPRERMARKKTISTLTTKVMIDLPYRRESDERALGVTGQPCVSERWVMLRPPFCWAPATQVEACFVIHSTVSMNGVITAGENPFQFNFRRKVLLRDGVIARVG
ncbi:hypothetical protein CDAR_29761 [Caerostris darwini]|uniref:Uncharacterized protein n=1 Tax=Caerostris darwini TaxID=1538125 RepID=A0AAV4QRH3_9ARAC|nr:hypothetical protein CDAR_29761 [Caerostris darwini]